MRERTTVGIGGRAPLLLEPRCRDELVDCLNLLRKEGIPFRMLGGGSNILVKDDVLREVVVSTRRLSRIFKAEDDEACLRVEAGASLPRFVSTCHKFGLKGAECLIGIPGTVGGAVVMNAGGRHGVIGDRIQGVTILGPDGSLVERFVTPSDFGYRTSALKDQILVDVKVRLDKGDQKEIWDTMTAWLKEKKEKQPLFGKSCGCVFKNPPGDSAGRLLEEAELKGYSRGDAYFSPQHANFILNRGGATFQDYFELLREGRSRVEDKWGYRLELEIEPWL